MRKLLHQQHGRLLGAREAVWDRVSAMLSADCKKGLTAVRAIAVTNNITYNHTQSITYTINATQCCCTITYTQCCTHNRAYNRAYNHIHTQCDTVDNTMTHIITYTHTHTHTQCYTDSSLHAHIHTFTRSMLHILSMHCTFSIPSPSHTPLHSPSRSL